MDNYHHAAARNNHPYPKPDHRYYRPPYTTPRYSPHAARYRRCSVLRGCFDSIPGTSNQHLTLLKSTWGGIYRIAGVDSSIRLAEHLQTSPSRNVDIRVDSFQVHGAPDRSFVVGPFPAGKVVEDALEVVGVAGLKGVGS